MGKIKLIIQREYLTRVKKKSFIVMTIVGPLLMALLMIAPLWIATLEDSDEKLVAVIDDSGRFQKSLINSETLKFDFLDSNTKVGSLKNDFENSGYYAILHIADTIRMYSEKQPNIGVKMHISNSINDEIERSKRKQLLKDLNIDNIEEKLDSIKSHINIQTIKWTNDGNEEQTSTEIAMLIGFISAFLIYMFIFIYGAQVMRGVIEEKTGRIVEIIISSVRPFQLMMGKILGIALVALTQFLLWIILTLAIVAPVNLLLISDSGIDSEQLLQNNEMLGQTNDAASQLSFLDSQNDMIQNTLQSVGNLPWLLMLFAFIFYFLGGYLLYASLFAAIGSAVDNEADTQQFMLPITIPLILTFVMSQVIIQNPEGSVAFWFSIVPFTSPIAMMIRISFGVPAWELILSMLLLVITFIGTTWLAAKIYRTGILMYGKKINYRELWKWLRYKN